MKFPGTRTTRRSGAVEGDANQTTGMENVTLIQSVDNQKTVQLADATNLHQDLNPQELPPVEPERVLVAPTRLIIDGFTEAMRVRVNRASPLTDGRKFVVQPGPATIEVDRFALDGSVVETRAGRVTFPSGQTSIVSYTDLAPIGGWSTQKKVLVAGLAAVTVAGVVYLVASRR